MNRGIPFDMELPAQKPLAVGSMTTVHLNTELEKGCADVATGQLHDLEDVVAEMLKDYNA